MAHNGNGTGWTESDPQNSEFVKDGANEIRDLRKGVRIRLEKEHVLPAGSSAGGEHKAGSAMTYYGGAAPTQKPDAATALHATADLGRLWNDGGSLKYWNGTTWVAFTAAASFASAVIGHLVAAGTGGGTATSGAWQTRTINFENDPSGVVALPGSNTFRLTAGTYEIVIEANAYQCNGHQCRLYNVTDAAVDAVGSAEFATATTPYGQTTSRVHHHAVLSGTTDFRIEHRVETTGSFGRAVSSSFSVQSVHMTCTVRRIA
jgi:hypothetical protein